MKRALLFLVPGALFGAGLAISGMTNPAKVTGFLDLFGAWDPSLACVMVGAIASYWLTTRLARRRAVPLLGGDFPGPPSNTIDARLVVGAALFGIGWGLLGFCPGPAVANLGALRPAALAFVPAMIAGMLVAQRGFGVDRA